MKFDKSAEFQAQLDHLLVLAALPGWKHYAWGRAKALDADQSGLFTGLAEALTTAATGQAAPSACEPPQAEKPL